MDRRNFLAAAGGVAGTLVSGIALGSDNRKRKGEINSDLIHTDAKIVAQLAIVRAKAFECVSAAQACIQHCQEQLIAGDATDFAECSINAHQMASICQNIGTLAAYKAKAIADFIQGCIKACDRCRLACKAHEAHFAHGMHAECQACMNSCQACLDACTALSNMI